MRCLHLFHFKSPKGNVYFTHTKRRNSDASILSEMVGLYLDFTKFTVENDSYSQLVLNTFRIS